jgi:hypothetical protein
MIELKQFAFQVEQLRMADERYDDLMERAAFANKEEDMKAAENVREMRRQLRVAVDASLKDIKNATHRIAPEQIEADTTLHSALEVSLKGWMQELELIQKETVDQALIDAKAGERSERYNMLEKREKELKVLITEAEPKLGKVAERVVNAAFSNQVSSIVNAAKP